MSSTSQSSTEEPTQAHFTPMSSPEADEELPFLHDEAVQQLRDEERAARAANNKARVVEQKRLAAKKKKQNVTESEKKEQAKQLDELLAKSAVSSSKRLRYTI